jgi:hypothetical protein
MYSLYMTGGDPVISIGKELIMKPPIPCPSGTGIGIIGSQKPPGTLRK